MWRESLLHFLEDHPGHPLGAGYPTGATLRIEFFHEASQTWRGESHLQAWERRVRLDPCSYCGAPYSGTVDHIEPKSWPARGIGSAHSWINLTGACESCNQSKDRKPLLLWLRDRQRRKAALKSDVQTLGQLSGVA